MKHKIQLRGIVQGVGCRYYCAQTARQLQLHGAVSNMPDGSVVIIVDTPDEEKAKRLAAAVKKNPFGYRFMGRIDSVSLSSYSGEITGDYMF